MVVTNQSDDYGPIWYRGLGPGHLLVADLQTNGSPVQYERKITC